MWRSQESTVENAGKAPWSLPNYEQSSLSQALTGFCSCWWWVFECLVCVHVCMCAWWMIACWLWMPESDIEYQWVLCSQRWPSCFTKQRFFIIFYFFLSFICSATFCFPVFHHICLPYKDTLIWTYRTWNFAFFPSLIKVQVSFKAVSEPRLFVLFYYLWPNWCLSLEKFLL